MNSARYLVWPTIGLASLLACKKASDQAPPRSNERPAVVPADAARVVAGPTWYRASVRSPDGVEARFFIGVPGAGAPGKATYKVGRYEMQNDATFDGTRLSIPIPVHEASVDAQVTEPGKLSGTFTTSWRTWEAASLPLSGIVVSEPTIGALETVGPAGEALDLGEPHSVWKLAMQDSGIGKLAIDQVAPGSFDAMFSLDTGNLIYLAGNGRGDELVLTGFDGTSGYRLELVLDGKRKQARGKFVGGHKLDWRETLTATRVSDVDVKVKARPTAARAKVELPPLPELSNLPAGPLVVELSGSWCSTCRYAAPVLVDLYRDYAPRGLQMVSLLYEFTDDPAFDAKRAESFRETYGVTWPVVPVPGELADFHEILPSNLTDINPAGFPITLFLRADRTIAAVHAGFPSPDATAEYQRVIAEFRGHIEKLLAK